MSILNPYLMFTGSAREAMEFYRGVFGGTLTVSTFGDFGQSGTPYEHQVMHAQLTTPAGFTLMASDQMPGMEGRSGNGTLSLSGDDEAELRGYWDALVSGGQVTMPLERQVWGDLYGQCADRYGVEWMVNIAAPQPA